MDHHVHAAITDGLRARGIDVLTSFEGETADWEDDDLLQRVTDADRVLFSQDRDLLVIASTWQSSSRDFAGIVYAHQLEITIGRPAAPRPRWVLYCIFPGQNVPPPEPAAREFWRSRALRLES